MKYLIIGLGNFGKTLAEELTEQGHDVIGIDINEHRVEDIKDSISVAYIIDATERMALKMLPLDEIDAAVVAIGHSMDSSLRAVSALKEFEVKKIYARAIDVTHMYILKAMNIKKIFIPESYAARVFADKFLDNFTKDML